jgi:fumarylacetoacetate (FAA) hydrolase
VILALARGAGSAELVGVIDGDAFVPVGEVPEGHGQELLLSLAIDREGLVEPGGPPVPLDAVRLLPPVPDPPSIRDFYAFEEHVRTAREGRGMAMDPGWYEQPVFYFTNPAAVIGPGEEVRPPRGSSALDYELEVAAVVGRECIDLDADDPATLDVVAGFTIMNDWSARDLQRREMAQMLGPAKGKDFATSLGPWLVTPDELEGFTSGRPAGRMLARVNGEVWSEGELADIHFPWGRILAHASADARLRPGDVIGSGTCGTGCILELQLTHGPEARPWLQAGDVVELDVDGIGVLRNTVAAR